MANNDDQNDDQNQQPSNKELRDKLEAALAKQKELEQQNLTLQATNLMPTLNERQRRVIMRELAEDKLDITQDNVAQVAEDLGYKLTPEPPAPPVSPTSSNNQNSDSQTNPPSTIPPEQEPGIMVSLQEMSAIDQAQYNATRGNLSPDFESKMRGAKSREELRNIIRNEGQASGIVHEWDDQ